MRDLGSRHVAVETAPLCLNLWASPPPRISIPGPSNFGIGCLWSYSEKDVLNTMCREVGEATGAKRVAVFLGDINRTHYLRSLAKTAHAYACATIGHDGFNPLLLDLILCRSEDVSYYVGDINKKFIPENAGDHSLRIFLGVPEEGPIAGYVVVSLQLYPALESPAHIIIVGRPNSLTKKRLNNLKESQ